MAKKEDGWLSMEMGGYCLSREMGGLDRKMGG